MNAGLLQQIASGGSTVKLPDPSLRYKQIQDATIGQQNVQLNGIKIQAAQAGQQEWDEVKAIFDKHAGNYQGAIAEVLQRPWRTPEITQTYQQAASAMRAEDMQNVNMMQGKPGPELSVAGPEIQRAPIGNSLTDPSSMSAPAAEPSPRRQVPLPVAPMRVRSAIGGQDQMVPRQTEQQLRAAAEAKERSTTDENIRQANEERIAKGPQVGEYSPGTLVITRDVNGKEISREAVPFAPKEKTAEQRAMDSWLLKNPGKDEDDYQTMDANRRRQMVNVNLETLRELDIENRTNASSGQVVFKNSGKPVARELPESAALRLEGIQTAIGQSDVVEKALLALGNSGAVKGYIEENGVYWPVVQDVLTPEQAEAVSETNRLLSAYAQAVSGLAVSEPEIQRLQRSAPSVKLTPEANKAILGHFRRNAIAKRDNYLDLRGWKLKEPDGTNGASFDEEIMNAIRGGAK